MAGSRPLCHHHRRQRIDHPKYASHSMYAKSLSRLLAVTLGLARVTAASAEEDCKAPSADCVAVGRWNVSVAVGAGVRTNPLVSGTDIPLVVIPQFSYYGKRFFIDDLDAGATLAEDGRNTFSLVASPGYDRVYFYRSDLQNIFVSGFSTATSTPALATIDTPGAIRYPPRARRITYLAGAEWTFKCAAFTGQLDVLHEITRQNGGNEVRAAVGVPLIQTRGSLTANLGITWKSAAIVNYYYGASNIYEPGSALNPFLKLGYTLPLAGKWRFKAFAEYERLGAAIGDSPIIREHYVATVFAGAVYTF
jgi:MipA family protein